MVIGAMAALCGIGFAQCDTNVQTLHSAALSACQVTTLENLFASDQFGQGAVQLCVDACVQAVSTLKDAADNCADTSTTLGADEAAAITSAFLTQLEVSQRLP